MKKRTKYMLIFILLTFFISGLNFAVEEISANSLDVIDHCNSVSITPASDIFGLETVSGDCGFGYDTRYTVSINTDTPVTEYNWWNYSYAEYSITSHNIINVYTDYAPEGIDLIKDIMCISSDGSTWTILQLNNKIVQTSENWIRVKTTFIIPQGATSIRLVFTAYNTSNGEIASWMQQIAKLEILVREILPESESFFYVDHCDNFYIHGQRADIYNVEILSNNISTVGDTSRLIYGTTGNEAYIDYNIVRQDTINVYIYEEILSGDSRPNGLIDVKFSLFGTVWEAEATSTEVEIGRFNAPKRYTRIKKTFLLPSVIESGKIRLHIYNNGDNNKYQIGRVEIYDSNSVNSIADSPFNGKNFQISAYKTQAEIGIDWVKDSVDFENGVAIMAASGINVNLPYIWQGDTLEYRHRLLNTAQKYGIKTYVYDAEFNNYLKISGYNQSTANTMIATYKNHPAFMGHFIIDEPNTSEINALQNASARYKTLLPEKSFFVNLLPNYSMSSQYNNYINNYFNKLNLDYLSFDYYALEGQENSYSMKTSFLQNLNYLAQKTTAEGAEFYTILCATGHYNDSDGIYLRRPQSENDLSFQAYTALAYGSRRITWFTYEAMIYHEIYGEQYGMLDSSGKKTEIYDYIYNVNDEIQFFADIYLNYNWTGTLLKEGSEGGVNQNFTNVGSAALQSHNTISSFTSTQDVILGTFSNGSNNAFLLSNFNDPILNISTSTTITFDKRYTLKIYNKGEMQQVELPTNKQYTFTLESGEGIFIEVFDPIKIDNCNSLVNHFDGDAYGVMVIESDVGFGMDKRFMATKNTTSPPNSSNWWDGFSYIEYKTYGVYSKIDLYVDYAVEGYGLFNDIMCIAFTDSGTQIINFSAKTVTQSSNWPRVKYIFELPQGTSNIRFIFTSYNNYDETIAVWMQQITGAELYY